MTLPGHGNRARRVIVSIDPDLPQVYWNSARLAQLLTNLLGNVIKFT